MFHIFYKLEHKKQLQRLYPEKIAPLDEQAETLIHKAGGVRLPDGENIFQFADHYSDAPFYVLDCVRKLKELLDKHQSLLYGYAIIISSDSLHEQEDLSNCFHNLSLSVTADNQIWIEQSIFERFSAFLHEPDKGDSPVLYTVRFKPQAMVGIEESYRSFVQREDIAPSFQKEINKWFYRQDDFPGLMLVSSCSREEIQYLLNTGLNDDSGVLEQYLTLDACPSYWDPWRPFVRFIDPPLLREVEPALSSEELTSWNLDYSYLNRICSRDWFLHYFDQMEHDYFKALIPYWKGCLKVLAGGRTLPVLVIMNPEDFKGRARKLLLHFIDTLHRTFPRQKFLFASKESQLPEDLNLPCLKLNIPLASRHFVEEKAEKIFPGKKSLIPLLGEKGEFQNKRLPDIFFRIFNAEERTHPAGAADLESCDAFLCNEDTGILELLLLCHRGQYCLSGKQIRRFFEEFAGVPLPVITERIKRLESLGFLRFFRFREREIRVRPMAPRIFEAISPERREKLSRYFALFLEKEMEKGKLPSPGGLFHALNQRESSRAGLKILNRILIHLLKIRETELAESLIDGPLFGNSVLTPEIQEGLQNIRLAGRMHAVLMGNDLEEIQAKVESGYLSLFGPKGLYRAEYLLQQACYHGLRGDSAAAQEAIKESLFLFQKEGDHSGCIRADIALGLTLLSQRKIRRAIDYFEMASRVSQQIHEPEAAMVSKKLKITAGYLFGNLSMALRSIERTIPQMEEERNTETWVYLIFFKGRILFELGQYEEAFHVFEKGRQRCLEYGLEQESIVIKHWLARALGFAKDGDAAEQILDGEPLSLECAYFRAEAAYSMGSIDKGIDLLEEAFTLKRTGAVYVQERDNWQDGFRLIEGRLSDKNQYEDVLLDQARGFYYRLLGLRGEAEKAWEGLKPMCCMDKVYNQQPFGYYFFLYGSEVLEKSGHGTVEERIGLISHAFKLLQTRAGRFDSQQMKHNFFKKNHRNFEIVRKAQELNLI